jgi:hypothetical protein
MADMNLTQAAEEVRKMLRGFKAVEMVSAALESVGSLQNAGKEAEKLLADTRAQIEAEKEALEHAQAAVVFAKEEARKVTNDAKRKAEDRIVKADVEIAVKVTDAAAAVAAASVRYQALEAQSVLAREAVVSAQKELDSINEKVAKAKAGVAKILGQ